MQNSIRSVPGLVLKLRRTHPQDLECLARCAVREVVVVILIPPVPALHDRQVSNRRHGPFWLLPRIHQREQCGPHCWAGRGLPLHRPRLRLAARLCPRVYGQGLWGGRCPHPACLRTYAPIGWLTGRC